LQDSSVCLNRRSPKIIESNTQNNDLRGILTFDYIRSNFKENKNKKVKFYSILILNSSSPFLKDYVNRN